MTRYSRNRPETAATGSREGFVVLSETPSPNAVDAFEVALYTVRVARRLGVQMTAARGVATLPYADNNDNLVFDAPIASWIANSRICYLRGWKQYESCVKGFNGLGLIVDLVARDLRKISQLTVAERTEVVHKFVSTRKHTVNGQLLPLFASSEARHLAGHSGQDISDLDLAIWRVCAERTIVCSTSSNMGISLHQILRYMQAAKVVIGGKQAPLLNADEGKLIIWCPDEEADFMNPEKSAALRAIEAELPKLTTLHTYINRKQRDPGALADALNLGGYFFPTNPQSKEEMQNLLANALRTMAAEQKCREADLLEVASISQVLATLGCSFEQGKLTVREGVESGLYGLMAAYLLMLDESLQDPELLAISTWNQASIGAALAAAVLADEGIRSWERLSPSVRDQVFELLPNLAKWADRHRLGVDVRTRIHGVFDIANLQSLAQLLGVVVERHSSGRGTAYVGLGSSSYSNGNRCYQILKDSERHGGPFHGKTTFHPATHTLNPIAQAIVVADDLYRAMSKVTRPATESVEKLAAHLARHVRKPEPAGAAALAGYLLARLDGGTLSVEEIAYSLRMSGFTKAIFLQLAGYSPDDEGASWFVQESSEEGELMAGLAESFLFCLDMDIGELSKSAESERTRSVAEYRAKPIDPPEFEALNPVVNIYLTGDNTQQPSEHWFEMIVGNLRNNLENMRSVVEGERAPAELLPSARAHPATRPVRLPSQLDLLGHVEQVFRTNTERAFIIDAMSGRTLSYGQTFEMARSIAKGLVGQGIKRGDRIAVFLPNGVPFAALYFSCLMTGIVAVPINPALTAKEIATILRLASVRLLVFAAGTAAKLEQVEATSNTPRLRLVTANSTGYGADGAGSVLDLDRAEAGDWGPPFADCRPEDPFVILFTSGTMALPKGVVHSAANELGNAVTFNTAQGFDRESRFLHVWPMAYSSGILNTLLSPFMAEGSVVLTAPFDARSALGFWDAIITNKVNTLWLSPTMLAALLAVDRDVRGPAYCKEYLRHVCCGMAALPLSVKRNFEQKYNVEIFESYGLTELLIVSANAPRYPRRDRSVGTALPGVDIRIGRPEDDDDQQEIGGEVLVSTQYAMLGYVGPESGGISGLAPGTYFPTGDIGRLDPDGNLYITGRKKDLIVRGGQTISPAAVRDTLLSCEGVEDAHVVGLPHHFYGEEVGAVVKLRDGSLFKNVEAKILERCRQELNPAAVPSMIAEVESFPLGSTGKVLAREIRNFLLARAPGKASES